MKIIDGDLLESPEQYLCHQCNCMSTKSAHLAKSVFDRFPHANIYAPRAGQDVPRPGEEPGKIVIRGDGAEHRLVINMLGQVYPGSPRFPDSPKDGRKAREGYFRQCLGRVLRLNQHERIESIAFPWGVGCGAAAGDWGVYQAMLQDFEMALGATVTIYKLN